MPLIEMDLSLFVEFSLVLLEKSLMLQFIKEHFLTINY